MQLDFAARELTIKLVYYGPALSGKTTNIQKLHARVAKDARGRLLMLDTHADRTLFFDLLPIHFRAEGGLSIKLKLYTVPGQVMHNATRRVVLQGADGVAFIADSQLSETAANNEAFENLRENLRAHGAEPDATPTVIQFNKRDLPADSIRSEAELDRLARRGREPVFKASALKGEGVLSTFLALARLSFEDLERRYQLQEKFGVSAEQFMHSVQAHFGVKPG
jgi:signal recognition particle receptor subunit beta